MGRDIYIVITGIILNFLFRLIIQITMAAKFGATGVMDAYFVAITIPTLIFIALLGPLRQSVVPVLSEYQVKRSKKELGDTISSLINLAFIVLSAFVLLIIFKISFLITLIAPGFDQNSESFLLTVKIARIVYPIITFGGLAGLLIAISLAQRRFVAPSLFPLAKDIIVLASILIFSAKIGILSPALGMLVGFILVVILLWKNLNLPYRLVINIKDEALMKIGKLLLPLVLSNLFFEIYTLIDRYFASKLPPGSISYLGYGFSIAYVPLSLTMSIATVSLPLLSRYWAQGKREDFHQLLGKGMRLAMVFILPVTVGLAFLSKPLISLVFERGAFTSQAAEATSSALLYYLPWLLFCTLSGILNTAFFSLQEIKTLLKARIFSFILKIILSFILVQYLSYQGLALATSLTLMFYFFVLFFSLQKRLRINKIKGVYPG